MVRKRRRGPTTEERNALLLALRRYKKDTTPSETDMRVTSSAIRKLAKGKLGYSPDLTEDEYAVLLEALDFVSASSNPYLVPSNAEARHLRGVGQMPNIGFWDDTDLATGREKLLERPKRYSKYDS